MVTDCPARRDDGHEPLCIVPPRPTPGVEILADHFFTTEEILSTMPLPCNYSVVSASQQAKNDDTVAFNPYCRNESGLTLASIPGVHQHSSARCTLSRLRYLFRVYANTVLFSLKICPVSLRRRHGRGGDRRGVGACVHGHAAIPLLPLFHGPWGGVRRREGPSGDFVLAAPSRNFKRGDRQGQADHQRVYAGERGLQLDGLRHLLLLRSTMAFAFVEKHDDHWATLVAQWSSCLLAPTTMVSTGGGGSGRG